MTFRFRRANRVSEISAPAASGLALIVTLLTSGALVLFTQLEHVNNTTVALIFLIPVGLSASLWGLVPGIAAAAVSFLAFNFFFIPDLYTFEVKQTEDLIVLAAFLGVAFVISELAGRVRHNLAAASMREQEAIRLYEFSTLLAATLDERAAARVMLEKIDQTLRPLRIEVLVETSPEPLLLARGVEPAGENAPSWVAPLQTTRELVGEIRLWLETPLLDPEERLLKIFASQGALAIERIRLGEQARKTRILEESDRLKSTLLSLVSHELRSPLAAVKASVSSLRSGTVEWESEARTELLATIEEEIDHLNVLVGNLLDMSRIEAGALKPQKKPNLLAEIVSAVTGRMRKQTQNHVLSVDVPDDLPLVNVDFIQMEQVFSNLLSNSLKYSPPGSTIQISARQTEPSRLEVKVRNQSLPLPEADLDKIFDKFYRINPSGQVVGSGLGLSICKGILEAHGGKIWAENVPGGTAFCFSLPLNESLPVSDN
jgi:two-component system sensor histidine kinase KdpD